MVSPMKHFQKFNKKSFMKVINMILFFLFSKIRYLSRLHYFKCLICLLILCHLYSEGLDIDYLGVYYKNIMYYISTDTNAKVVKHFLDQGNKNRIIEIAKFQINILVPAWQHYRVCTLGWALWNWSSSEFEFDHTRLSS